MFLMLFVLTFRCFLMSKVFRRFHMCFVLNFFWSMFPYFSHFTNFFSLFLFFIPPFFCLSNLACFCKVILTVSVAIMKRQLITLNPPLPAPQRNAFDRFTSDCVYAKLLLQFPTVFWDPTERINFVPNTTRGDLGSSIVNLNHQTYEPGSRILNFQVVADVARQLEAEPIELR